MSDTWAIAVFERRFNTTNVLLFIGLLGVGDVSIATITNLRPTLFVFKDRVSVLRFVRVDFVYRRNPRSSTVPNRRLTKVEYTKRSEKLCFGGGFGNELGFEGAL